MRQACNFHGLNLDNEAIEVEWNKGKEIMLPEENSGCGVAAP